MERLRGFGDVLLAGLVALVACAVLWYLGLVVFGAATSGPQPDWGLLLLLSGIVVFYGLVVALPVLVVLAAPAYAVLLRAGHASYAAATAIGAVPGAVLLFFSGRVGLAALATGVAVGVATHWACKVRSNNSSKPTPLRGAA